MKLRVTFKTPDAVYAAVRDEVGGDDIEDVAVGAIIELALRAIDRFVKHRECVTIVFDTEAGTAEVVRVK
jgi:hypothetical protein